MQQIRGFRVVHVFDISQTEGEDLPDIDAVRPKLLDGDAPEGIWDALTAHAGAIGYEVIRHRRGSENGYCDFTAKQIAVRPNVSAAQAIKTLIHELGHALLHAEGPVASREVAEVESVPDHNCNTRAQPLGAACARRGSQRLGQASPSHPRAGVSLSAAAVESLVQLPQCFTSAVLFRDVLVPKLGLVEPFH